MKKILLTLLLVLAPFAAHAEYSRPYIGDMTEYRAKYEDTFVYLARDYNLGFVEMRAANPAVDPWLPGSGTKLVLPTCCRMRRARASSSTCPKCGCMLS